MKISIVAILFAAFAILVVACKKEVTSASVTGTWELRMDGGGWTPVTHYPAGNGRLITFTNTTYEIDSVGKTIGSGTYKIIKDKCLLTQETSDRIIYNNVNDNVKTFIKISNDTLSFIIDAYDASASVYVKQ